MSMDKIYIPKTDLPFINIGQRHREHQNAYAEFPGPRASSETIESSLGWSGTAEQFAALEESVSLDQLGDAHDLRICPYDPSEYRPDKLSRLDMPTKALSTLRTLAGLADNSKLYSRSQRSRYIKFGKYRTIAIAKDPDEVADIEPAGELLVVVRVYEPFKYIPQSEARMRMRLKQRITLLASQTLCDLRDRIYCPCSVHGPFPDISKNPHGEEATSSSTGARKKAEQRKSNDDDPGFFFITDTFYADTRHSGSEKYTQPIRDWARLHPKEVGVFTAATIEMQSTRLVDLRVRLGVPLLYQHYGNCEHVFTVSDVRLIGAGDVLQRRRYPLVDMVSMARKRSCATCGVAEATVVVCESELHIQDPAFLCEGCFTSCHYVDGAKVGTFRAFKYVGNRDMNIKDA